MIMMREIALGQKKYLLENQVILFCPVFNADGNDAMSPNNRPSQDGSPVEAGERYSGEGLDLNRDGLKLESIEGKALMNNVIRRWNPIMFVDLHTTNGTWHGYPLTFAPGIATAGHPGASRYLMEDLFPEVSEKVRERSGIDTYLYGNFSEFPPKQYNGMLPQPRYLTNALALRNMFCILVETFAHDRFERRILSNLSFLTSLLEYTSDHGHEMNSLFKNMQGEIQYEIETNAGHFTKGVRFDRVQSGLSSDLLVYETGTNIDQFGIERPRRTGRRYWVSGVRKMTGAAPNREATVPMAYVFPPELENVAGKLREHGISVAELSSSEEFTGETFTVTSFTRSSYNYQGHNLTSIGGYFSNEVQSYPQGSFYVELDNPLAYLTFYLLEPESDDGLTIWNYFDDYLIDHGVQTGDVTFPVFKVLESGQSARNTELENLISINPDRQNGNIRINKSFTEQLVLIKIMDPLGREISEYQIKAGQTSATISMTESALGLYLIRIKSGNDQFTKKIIWN